MLRRGGEGNRDEDLDETSDATQIGQSSADDESIVVSCQSTDEAPKFEDEQVYQERALERKVFEYFPPHRLKRNEGQKCGGEVPGHLIDAVKFTRIIKGRRGYNARVQVDDEATKRAAMMLVRALPLGKSEVSMSPTGAICAAGAGEAIALSIFLGGVTSS